MSKKKNEQNNREPWVLDIVSDNGDYALVTVKTSDGERLVYKIPRKTISSAIIKEREKNLANA